MTLDKSIIPFDYDHYEKAANEAMKNNCLERLDSDFGAEWCFRNGIQPLAVQEKMSSMVYPRAAIITAGENEGLYIVSVKERECFYYETDIERQKRETREREREREKERIENEKKMLFEKEGEERTKKAYLLLYLLGFLGAHKFYLGKPEDGWGYIILFLICWLIIPGIALVLLLIRDWFTIPRQVREYYGVP